MNAMLAMWLGIASVLPLALTSGCGGRTSQDLMQTVGGADAMSSASDVAGANSVAASSAASAGSATQLDGGQLAYCSGMNASGCTFSATDRTDLPPEQRFGAIAQWQQLPYLSIAACGDAIFAVDHNGCVSAAPDNIETAFSVGVLRYVEQFAWPCAADQRVFVSLSCTIR